MSNLDYLQLQNCAIRFYIKKKFHFKKMKKKDRH